MANLDLKKTLKHLYSPSKKEVTVVTVEPTSFLMIDGRGNPNTSEQYVQAVQALYNVSYAIRAICKAQGNIFTVMPLEGLWWFEGQEEGRTIQSEADKDDFYWTMMIRQPDFVNAAMVTSAIETTRKKKTPPRLNEIRFESYDEGEAAHIMHIGPYDDEGPNIEKIHQYITDNGWSLSGLHHEIYLSDPRKVSPEKMKTVIRQPFTR